MVSAVWNYLDVVPVYATVTQYEIVRSWLFTFSAIKTELRTVNS